MLDNKFFLTSVAKFLRRGCVDRGTIGGKVVVVVDSSKRKVSSVSDISKYNDALKWGAGVVKQRLPTEYYKKIVKFVAAYKKEHASAKKEGNVDEREADPINGNLFTLICKWAVEEMNILISLSLNVAHDSLVYLHIFQCLTQY